MLNSTTLIAAGIAPRVAEAFAGPLAQACERFEIHTPARVAAFVSQCAFESRGFVVLEERMLHRTPERICATWPLRVPDLGTAEALVGAPQALANTVHAGCHGNGDAASGDGWRYRGRGLIRLLGRATYCAAGTALQRPYEEQPDLVARPADACWAAAWLWHSRGLNELADRLQFDAITRFLLHEPVSPMSGLYERRALYRGALAALEDMRC
ncbi:glycoside hydrolase family 19 protein [Azohydromonas caseinilytica]|uniref:Glycoside hydrolase family 19 protein n=1 Tax=Azohydromonas caseinilytica TaxID=2728836 RepID=A0A848FEF8_9BURK|nr:glycoside hydrolase family 19 protein [Azohydromonas caseinilytica]NML17205.1 glycoside hydrolase family 19 protein [Azohydromonas caseinilytica]